MRDGGSTPGAIVIGGFVNGLGIVRATRARKARTGLITTQPFDIAQHAKGVDHLGHVEQLYDRPHALFDLLECRAPDWRGSLVIPTNDDALASLSAHRDELARWYRLMVPPPDVIPALLDKSVMLEAAADVGISTPRRYGPATAETLTLDDVGFPVVIKPDAGHVFSARTGVKLLSANDPVELREGLDRFQDAGVPGGVFDLIPGDAGQIFVYCLYVDAHGEPSEGVTIRKIRQSPALFGVSRVAELADESKRLRQPTVELLRRIGFRGIAAAEYKLDPRDGTFRFIELNGRSVIYNSLLARGGLDTVALGWADYVSGAAPRVEPTAWDGAWIHLHADLLRATFDRAEERQGARELLREYRRKKLFAVWSASDPKPFVRQWARTARQAPRVLLGRG